MLPRLFYSSRILQCECHAPTPTSIVQNLRGCKRKAAAKSSSPRIGFVQYSQHVVEFVIKNQPYIRNSLSQNRLLVLLIILITLSINIMSRSIRLKEFAASQVYFTTPNDTYLTYAPLLDQQRSYFISTDGDGYINTALQHQAPPN